MPDESWRDFYGQPSPDISRPSDPDDDGVFRADEGRGVVDLPLRIPLGARRVESVQVRDIPAHVARQIERSFTHGDDPAGDPSAPGRPHEVLGWYAGLAKGSGIVDTATHKRLDQFVDGMARAGDQRKYYAETVKPFLLEMRPKRADKG